MPQKNNSLGNPNQIAFCNSVGNTVLQAGPGTGKTYSIQIAIEYFYSIIETIEEQQCLAITFTNAAANELRNRINRMIDIYTFHAFAREVIYLNDGLYPNIITDADILTVIKDIIKELDLKNIKDRELLNGIKRDPDNNQEALILYTKHKNDMFLMDFDDLLLKATEYLNNDLNLLDYCIVFVDETQDVSQLQLNLLYAMQRQNCCIQFKFVGDPNQSIMGFAGAVRNVMKILAERFDGKIMQLNETFRSCPEVVDVYKDFAIEPVVNLITHNMNKGHAQKVTSYDTDEENRFIVRTIKALPEGTTVGVLTRTRKSLESIELALVTAKIQCNTIGTRSFYTNKDISLLVAWLKFYFNPFDTISGVNILTQFKSVGKSSAEKILLKYKGNPNLAPTINNPLMAIDKAHKDGLDSKGILLALLKELDYWSMKSFKKTSTQTTYEHEKQLVSRKQRVNDFIESGADIQIHEFVYKTLSTTEKDTNSNNTSLLTFHSSKGLEFDVVFVVGVEDGFVPNYRANTPYEIEQERSAMFVALSRARYKMYITRAKNRSIFGKYQRMDQSIWWNDIIIRDKITVKSAEIENIDLNPDKIIYTWTCECGTKNDVYEEVEGDFSAKVVNKDGTKDRLCFCSNCSHYIQLVKVA